MSQNSVENYLQFVREVLGVHKILTTEDLKTVSPFLGPQGPLVDEQLMKKYDIVFINRRFTQKESLFQPKTYELFKKMRQAMKLNKKSILEVDTEIVHFEDLTKNIHAFLNTSFVVLMTVDSEHGDLTPYYNFELLQCPLPYMMLTQTDLKKPAWEQLQKVMARG